MSRGGPKNTAAFSKSRNYPARKSCQPNMLHPFSKHRLQARQLFGHVTEITEAAQSTLKLLAPRLVHKWAMLSSYHRICVITPDFPR
jgi:hypothetical protein